MPIPGPTADHLTHRRINRKPFRVVRILVPKTAPKETRRRLAKNKISLADALSQFLKGKAKVTIAEAMEGVLSAGYKTKSKAFRQVVNQTLLKDERFKSVGRGEFALKA